jgi:hypothetical protein
MVLIAAPQYGSLISDQLFMRQILLNWPSPMLINGLIDLFHEGN